MGFFDGISPFQLMNDSIACFSLWRHDMNTLSLLASCKQSQPVTVWFHSQSPLDLPVIWEAHVTSF